jgi:hypothetical protein
MQGANAGVVVHARPTSAAAALRGITLFAEVAEPALEELERQVRTARFANHQQIVHEADDSQRLIGLLRGGARVYRTALSGAQVTLETLAGGDL